MTEQEIIASIPVNGLRWNKYLNENGFYQTSAGVNVETVPHFMARKDAEIDARYPDGFINRGDYNPNSVQYNVNDIVTYGDYAYLNIRAYVSTIVMPDADRNHWVLYAGVTQAEQTAAFAQRDIQRGKIGTEYTNMLQTMERSYMRLTESLIKAIQSGEVVRVALLSSSIGENADVHGANHYFRYMENRLRAEFPFVTFEFLNLSLGGRDIYNAADPSFVAGTAEAPGAFFRYPNWQNTELATWNNYAAEFVKENVWRNGSVAGKSWRDHFKDFAPHVIMLHHGMNGGGDVNAYIASVNAFIAYSNTWPIQPWYIFGAEYLPVNDKGDWPGDAWWTNNDNQNGTQGIADACKAIALKNGYGLIDFNAFYRMQRDGINIGNQIYKTEKGFRFLGSGVVDNEYWFNATGSTVNGSGQLSFVGSATLVSRKVIARDAYQAGVFIASVDGMVPKFAFRRKVASADLSGITVQAAPLDANNTQIAIFNETTALKFDTIPVGVKAGDRIGMAVWVEHGNIHVWFQKNGGQRFYIYNSYLTTLSQFTAGAFGVGVFGDPGAVVDHYECTYAQTNALIDKTNGTAPDYASQEDLMGVKSTQFYGDYSWNPDSLGGDFLHHVGDVGSHLYMIPAVGKWINEFHDAVRVAISSPTPAVFFYSNLVKLNTGTGVRTDTGIPVQMRVTRLNKELVNVRGQCSGVTPAITLTANEELAIVLPYRGNGGVGSQSGNLGLILGLVSADPANLIGFQATQEASTNLLLIRSSLKVAPYYGRVAELSVGGVIVFDITYEFVFNNV